MKWSAILRPLAVSLMAGFLVASVAPMQAMVFRDNGSSFWEKAKEKEQEREREKDRERYKRDDKDTKSRSVPEGSGRILIILAAGALGGSVLVWRRKQRANVS